MVGVALAVMGCDSTEQDEGQATTTVPSSSAPTTSLRVTTTTQTSGGVLLSVQGPLRSGEEFIVSFSGPLQTSRGGYLWLETVDGSRVALLRSDGNPDIPMGYELDPTKQEQLDDAISGATSTFVLPPNLTAGPYVLCTANSRPDACAEVVIR